MPVHVGKQGKLFRLLEPSGALATTSQGHARDGGGHATRNKAEAQARAINASLAKSLLNEASRNVLAASFILGLF